MQKPLLIKLSIIAILCCIFGIGLSMLTTLVKDRQQNADAVVAEIAKQHVYPQQLITPFIVIPKTVTPSCTPQAAKEEKCKPKTTHTKTILASQTDNVQNLTVSNDTYQRSVYHAISYSGDISFKQRFLLRSSDALQSTEHPSQVIANASNLTAANEAKLSSREVIEWQKARIILPISDLRGVTTLPKVTINNKAVNARYPDAPTFAGLSYIEIPIPAEFVQKSALDISIKLPISGISNISTVPTGNQYRLTMRSDWAAPNFGGQALPNTKSLDTEGFEATWQNQYLALANNQHLRECLETASQNCIIKSKTNLTMNSESFNTPYATRRNRYNDSMASVEAATNSDNVRTSKRIQLSGFAVSFAEPNDVYLQTERSMKYALLLILVSFGTFFLFEVLKATRIHPMQYLMVGSALLIFYVLLLPLAEQIPFWQAYTISAFACIGLIGWYTSYVLGNVKRASIFTLLLSALYAGFYGILSSEDMNLLIGAVFCFILLASVMYFTRKIDWYQVA